MSGHTPGPWELRKYHAGWYGTAPSPGYNPARTVFECRSGKNADAECAANANLIAAAPETAAERDRLKEVNAELLAALKHAVRWHDQLSETDIGMMFAAIAKAEGRA